MPFLSFQWEYFGDLVDATRRFASGAAFPTVTLDALDDGTVVLIPGATKTVWDSASSPLTDFDFLYLQAQDAAVQIEVTITVTGTPQVSVFTLPANSQPFSLGSSLAYQTLGGTAGLVTKVRASASSANTTNATLRYGVGQEV